MRTISFKNLDIKKEWVHVDAGGKTLGRLASEIARVLRGKHKPTFTPHIDSGDCVVVTNAEKVVVTGRKIDQKNYYHHTGYAGGIKTTPIRTMLATHPQRVIENAVAGMLPKSKLGRKVLDNMKVYAGAEHPHSAQQPKPMGERLVK